MRHTSTILAPIVLVLSALAPAPAAAQTGDSATLPRVIPAGAPMSAARPDSSALRSDVARRAVEVFGDSLATVRADAEPSWDMDVRSYETQDRVAHYVEQFTGRSKERITRRLESGTRYEPMIRAKMKAGGLPEDMYYLALVESGFDPHAYSRAAAVGMWQFMTSTGRDMGLRIDWWVDERRDPIRSTTAAVQFIRGLRDQFGSLYLAAAAYNGGPGRVARGLARFAGDLENVQGDDAFFVLAGKDYLKNETREYVPQLIAAALIAKEPARYGMELHSRAPLAYDSLRVPPNTPLAAIATAASVTLAEISDLNPQLLRGMTPPRDSFLVRLPVGAGEGFDAAFSALPREARVATRVVETKKGDSPEQIAGAAGVSTSALMAFNPRVRRLKSGRLAPGQPLVVPTSAVAAAALSIPDPSIEKYPGSTRKMKVHAVRKGESIGVIARKYGITSARLMSMNGLKKPVIFPGQSLIVSGTPVKAVKARTTAGGKASTKAAARSKSKVKAKVPARAKPSARTGESAKAKSSVGAGSMAKAKSAASTKTRAKV